MKRLHEADLDEAAQLLLQEELVAFPTETVYGLGALLFSEMAVRKIFAAKKRPPDNPLIAHISSIEQAFLLSDRLPPSFFQLAEAFFPGPLTIVVEKKNTVPSIVSAGLSTIGIRMPHHPLALKLISMVGSPLAAPSANLSGRPSSTSAFHVLEDFSTSAAAVIDGGQCAVGVESTVLFLAKDPLILRPGAITAEMLSEVLSVGVKEARGQELHRSPGTRYRHYSPKADVVLFYQTQDLNNYTSNKKKLILKSIDCATLYNILRNADQLGYEEILILCTPKITSNPALMDRLMKASSKK